VLLKGRVACEVSLSLVAFLLLSPFADVSARFVQINSASELVLTELILENTFADFAPEEVVALLSCFIFQEKTDVEPLLTPALEDGKAQILAITDRVRRVQEAQRANFAEEGFGGTELKFGLVEVVYEWARGMAFSQICALTDVQEGTIVRAITRLDETCREVRDAARIVGNSDLFGKMEECQQRIRRDIVFTPSLYM
jgi:antiviral helicase SKI2